MNPRDPKKSPSPEASGESADRIRVGVGSVSREIEPGSPAGDAPAWSLDTQHRLLEKKHTRLDGPEKASGRAKYPTDIAVPGMLHAVILRSTIAHGRVEAIDTSAAEKLPGVRGIEVRTGPGRQVRHLGQEILAIAAETEQQAKDACDVVLVQYQRQEHEVAPEDEVRARETAEAQSFPAQLSETGKVSNEPQAAELDYVFETAVQMHHPLEPHGVTCVPESDGGLTVHASTQGTFSMRRAIARSLRMAENKVRVLTPYMGGGFGGKLTAGVEAAMCAALAMKTGKPVRLFADREGEATSLGNRPSSIQRIQASCDASGKITGWSLRSFGFPGYGGSGRVAFPNHYFRGVRGMRRPQHQDINSHTGSARAFRAPGHPQGYFACESMIDELAWQCGMDPLVFRLRNLEGDPVHQEQLRICAEQIGWKEHFRKDPRERGDSRIVEGVGLGIGSWGGMGRGRSSVLCRIHSDGHVEVRNGAQDIGTGTRTVLGLVAAETLGVDLDRIRVALGDTNDPSGPGSGGSVTAPTLAPAARHAAWLAGRELATRVAEAEGKDADSARLEEGHIVLGDRKISWADACRKLGNEPVEAVGRRFPNWNGFSSRAAGAQAAHVAVDLDTGLVTVKKHVAVQDCGLVVDQLTAESQVLGAVIQGISFALFEERHTDPAGGQVINRDFEHFKIIGPKEMPEIVTILQDGNNGHTNAGVVGLGEPPTVPTAAAVANAVRNATGVRMFRLPMTPARVFAALSRTEGAR